MVETAGWIDGATTRVSVVRAEDDSADRPVVVLGSYLASTPASTLAAYAGEDWTAGSRDVVLIGTRLDAHAVPVLGCETDSWDHDLQLHGEGPLERCASRLRSEGIELSAITTAGAARDVSDALDVLGIEDFDLLASGTGAQVAERLAASGRQRPFEALYIEPALSGAPPLSDRYSTLQRVIRTAEPLCEGSDRCNAGVDHLAALREVVRSVDIDRPTVTQLARAYRSHDNFGDVLDGEALLYQLWWFASDRSDPDSMALMLGSIELLAEGNHQEAIDLLYERASSNERVVVAEVPPQPEYDVRRWAFPCNEPGYLGDPDEAVREALELFGANVEESVSLDHACAAYVDAPADVPTSGTGEDPAALTVLVGDLDPWADPSTLRVDLPESAAISVIAGHGHDLYTLPCVRAAVAALLVGDPIPQRPCDSGRGGASE